MFTISTSHFDTTFNKQTPLLFCNEGRFAWFIKANCSAVRENYWPTIWAYETHILTPLANFLRGLLPELKYHRYVEG